MSYIHRSVSSPKKFIIGQHVIKDLHRYIKDFGDNAFLVVDEFFMDFIQNDISPCLSDNGIESTAEKFGGESSHKEIQRLKAISDAASCNVIVGIGGGKTLDSAKAVAYYSKKPVIIVPTIASTDAPCTALSVIYKENGEFEEYLFLPQNPDAVLADTAIIVKAPVRFFAAGVGDALATYFEARACVQSDGLNLILQKPTYTGLGLARMCYDVLNDNIEAAMDAVRSQVATPAFERTIEALIYLSGVGAESGGLAAAHAVNNGMSLVPDLHRTQHGEKVVFGLLTQLVLEGADKIEIDNVIRIIKTAGLPLTLKDFKVEKWDEAVWRRVAEMACAENDTMKNMPRSVNAEDVYNAMVAATSLAERYKSQS